jgi:hypothetical protein
MAENKTKATDVSVADFLERKAVGQQLIDSRILIKLFTAVAGKPARMWGPSIVGFGSYHYVYASGREGDAPLLGFSPRKPAIVLYVAPYAGDQALKRKLGKYRAGAGCLYVKKLEDIDLGVLRELGRASVKALRKRNPGK